MMICKRLIALFLLLVPSVVSAEVRVVATLPALGQIAQAVVGDAGTVQVLARVGQDPHFVPPKPTLARHLARADLLFTAGLALEMGWLPSLIEVARNPSIRPGATGHFEGASAIEVIGVMDAVDRSMGDVHPEGNPHWWLDPLRAGEVAGALAERLALINPAQASGYRERAAAFDAELRALTALWHPKFTTVAPVMTYHDSYRYLVERFAIPVAGYIEPKPGVEPSPRHLDELLQRMDVKGVKQLWVEPYHHGRVAKRVAGLSGLPLLIMPDSIEGEGAAAYIALIELLLNRALGKSL